MTNVWPKQADCARLFGNPFNDGWSSTHLTRVVPPFAMSMGSLHVSTVQINKIAAASLSRVFAAVDAGCEHDPIKIGKTHCNCFSGSFALRNMRGLSNVSMHAYGLAIDLDAPRNPLGAPPSKTFFTPESPVVKAFEAEGWAWGGRWKGRRDAMHFQAANV